MADESSAAVRTELDGIAERNGGLLKPEDVVEFARTNKQSELHGRFEWDDTKAAHAHRLEQARGIIRVFVEVIPHTQTSYRAYVSLEPDRHSGEGYRRTVQVMSNEEHRQQLLLQAIKRLNGMRREYAILTELAEVFQALDRVAARTG